MLVRDPSKRANLSEIVDNAWVKAGDRGHAKVVILTILMKHQNDIVRKDEAGECNFRVLTDF